ncbi:T9SS type A sorting domain-containing protein [bacterium]|nr:T9SS type A sorting domain-containing protein [bacterium]
MGSRSPGNSDYSIQIQHVDEHGIKLKLTIERFSIDVHPEHENFSEIRLSGAGYSMDIGKPMLPVIRRYIQVPQSAGYEINTAFVEQRSYNLSATGYSTRVIPRQPPVEKNDERMQEFKIDGSYYATNQMLPQESEIVKIQNLGVLRGTPLGELVIVPIRYNPVSGEIIVISTMEIEVKFRAGIRSDPRLANSVSFREIKRAAILNLAPSEVTDLVTLPCVYLIIAGDAFIDEISDFVNWKSQKGYTVVVESYSGVGGSLTGLQDYIANAYSTWEHPPEFVLLIGDVEHIPANYVTGFYTHYTDLYFVTVDGEDFLPDILIGRVSVQDVDQLHTSLDRIIEYEKTAFHNRDWLKKPLFMACGDDGDWELAEGTHRYVYSRYMPYPDFEVDSVWAHSGGTGTDVINSLNDGRFLANYSGHGYSGGWGNPGMAISDIEGLDNDGMLPFVMSNSCLTGKFNESTCFGEAWIRTPDRGAIAFLGASNSTYWTEDDIFEKRWYDAIFEDNIYTLTGATYKANLDLMLFGTSLDRYYFEVYNLLGDPSMSLYWGIPEDIVVAYTPMVPIGIEEFSYFGTTENALIALWREEGPFGQSYTIAGSSAVPLNPIPVDSGRAVLTLTAPNYTTFQDTIPIFIFAQMIISVDSLIVEELNSFTVFVDSSGHPLRNVTVSIRGLEVSVSRLTNAEGIASFDIIPPYVEYLQVKAIHSTAGIIADEMLRVGGGLPFGELEYSISSPEVLLEGYFAQGFECLLEAYSPGGLYTVWLEGCCIDTAVSTEPESCSIHLTPTRTGEVSLCFAKIGRTVMYESATVIRARGSFIGTTIDDSDEAPVIGVKIEIYHQGDDTSLVEPVVQLYSDSSGSFNSPEDYYCGWYDVYCYHFGYLTFSDSIFINTVGGYTLRLEQRPSSEFSGVTVPDKVEILLNWEVNGQNIYRIVSNEGTFRIPNVTYQAYTLYAQKRGYKTYRHIMEVSAATPPIEILLEPAAGEILLVDNARYWESPAIFNSALTAMGYSVTLVEPPLASHDFMDYNLIVWSTGGAGAPISLMDLMSLEEYKEAGGKVLFEGAEIPFYVLDSYYEYAESLFFIDEFMGDDPESLFSNPRYRTSSLYNVPNPLPERLPIIDITPATFVAFDVFTPIGGANLLYLASSCDPYGGCISYFDDNFSGGVNRQILLALNLDSCFTDDRVIEPLVQNSVEFLLGPDFNLASVFGFVNLSESGNNSWATVTLTSATDSFSVLTPRDGRFNFLELEPGEYSLSVSKHRYVDTTIVLNITQGMNYGCYVFDMVYTGIEEESNLKPDAYYLGANYPNPFNSATNIRIHTPERAEAMFTVYDVLGKAVYSEVIKFADAGIYNYTFNGNDQDGNALSSGVYFYRFEADKYKATRKFLLLR